MFIFNILFNFFNCLYFVGFYWFDIGFFILFLVFWGSGVCESGGNKFFWEIINNKEKKIVFFR